MQLPPREQSRTLSTTLLGPQSLSVKEMSGPGPASPDNSAALF